MSKETQEAVQQPRKVTLWSTKTGKKASLTSSVTTWGELQKEIKGIGDFSIDGMLATESIKRTDLANVEAVLPEVDFVIFFRPKEVKSGLDRKELFAAIKTWIGSDAGRKQLFIIDGKNMTQLPTTLLQELHDKHVKGGKAAPAAKVAPVKVKKEGKKAVAAKATSSASATNVTDLVEATKEELLEQMAEIKKARIILEGVANKVTISGVDISLRGTIAELDLVVETLEGKIPGETAAEKEAREEREADEAETAALKEEAKRLMGGYKK